MRTKDEAKEKLILETALQLITRVGMAGLKMSDLAKEAGVATGTLYVYFDDKPALIQTLYRYLLRQNLNDLTLGIGDSDPLRIKLQKIARNYFNDCVEHPEYTIFFEQYFRSPYAVETPDLRAEEQAMLQPILDLVVQGQRETIIKDANPDLLVTLVCGMLSELAKQVPFTGQPLSDADWETTFGVIWDGIKR
ncbi:TetR/AcrR family transcriptional regulator [Spirosoma montaniterrae]|uniref:TetR family transcriptional regulator n=1 Tax=Spirosoma montaniterrae TaxID=1178516 RepID=A0A1P9WRQ0_9BACT|nr:TetR/AcrR family transcriptional regulator [Spirosoma montaniterrae]AQG78057.1 TetR family transcriptional regulator [Spirosoma montaniterrae]